VSVVKVVLAVKDERACKASSRPTATKVTRAGKALPVVMVAKAISACKARRVCKAIKAT